MRSKAASLGSPARSTAMDSPKAAYFLGRKEVNPAFFWKSSKVY